MIWALVAKVVCADFSPRAIGYRKFRRYLHNSTLRRRSRLLLDTSPFRHVIYFKGRRYVVHGDES